MNRTHRFALTAVLSSLTVSAACGAGDRGVFGRSKASGTVAVVLREEATAEARALKGGLEAEAKSKGLTLSFATSGGDAAREREAVQRFLNGKAAAVVVEAADSVTATADAQAASAAKVPFFTIGTPSTVRAASHVEGDFDGAGRVAAEYLATFLGGKGVVAVVRAPLMHGALEMERGFREAMAAHKGMTVAATVDATDRASASAGVLALLRAQRPLKGLFAMSPELAVGAAASALTGRRADVSIVSFGASDEVRAAVANAAEAPIKAMVVGELREMGRRTIDAVALELGDEPVAARIAVPVRLITRDSARAAP